MSHFFISRPIFASVISIVIIIIGLVGLIRLPIASYPDITPPTVSVTTTYPGANALDVAKYVATPIEEQVNGVENMIYMLSKCTNDGKMTLDVTFKPGVNLDMAQVLVQNRVAIAEAKLPDEVKRQGVTTKKKSPSILLVVNLISEPELDPSTGKPAIDPKTKKIKYKKDQIYLSNFGTINIKDRLARIEGVGDVAFLGPRDYSMRIWLDPQKLSSIGMTASEVVQSLREQNIQVPAGRVGQPPVPKGQDYDYPINVKGRLQSEKEFGDVIIKTGKKGRIVYLKNVVRGKDGIQLGAYNYDVSSFLDGQPAVAIGIFQLPGSNALETAQSVRKTMEELKDTIFVEGVDYKIVYDTTVFIEESINEVYSTLIDAIILVFLVVLVFLQDWRTTIIPMVAVPVSLVGTFFLMSAFGFSLNNLSLFGLILAIGIVVDDAIVVVENTERYLAQGFEPREATGKAMSEITGALVATTLVMCSVFVPVAFLSGISGQFYRQFALTIASATVISTVNALTISPALCALLLRKGEGENQKKDGLPRIGGVIIVGFLAVYFLGPLGMSGVSSLLDPQTKNPITDIKPSPDGKKTQITTEYDHDFEVSDRVQIQGVNEKIYPRINGDKKVVEVIDPKNFVVGVKLLNPNASKDDETQPTVSLIVPNSLKNSPMRRWMVYGVVFLLAGLLGWFINLFFAGFNFVFDLVIGGYGFGLALLLRTAIISLLAYFGLLVLTGFTFQAVPGGFIPNQDKGYLLVNVQLPDGASLERTEKVVGELSRIARETPGVAHTIGVPGYSVLTGTNVSNVGGMFVILDSFENRKDSKDLYADNIAARLRKEFKSRGLDAQIAVFGAPPVDGLGSTGGFKMQIKDQTGSDMRKLEGTVQNLAKLGNAQDGLVGLFSSFSAKQPQVEIIVDRVQAQTRDVPISNIFNELGVFFGSSYVNDVNLFGRNWQVLVQAAPEFRNEQSDFQKVKVRNTKGDMVSLGAFIETEDTIGPPIVNRYNMFYAAELSGATLPGTSSGQAIEIMSELAKKNSVNFEWTELSYQELEAGKDPLTPFIFPLCVLLVFLTLSAQYESWSLPLAIILIVPMSSLCAIVGILLAGLENNIFTQIGLVVLIGLAAKNAILMVEFAKQKQDEGLSRFDAALEASKLRLRPILMTSFSFILGVLPLVLATGAGAEMRETLGIAVFTGMLGVTVFGLLLTPIFYLIIRWVTERGWSRNEPAK